MTKTGKIIIFSLAALVVVAGGAAALLVRLAPYPEKAMPFINAYGEYYAQAQVQSAAVISPGSGDNRHRKSIHAALTRILTEEIDDAERLALAQKAQKEVEALRKEIDQAMEVREQVERNLKEVARAREALPRDAARRAKVLVALFARRQSLVADITATLYAINGQIEEILSEVIAQEGALTPAHIQRINDMTGDAEFRFDRLGELYRSLGVVEKEISGAAEALVASVF